MLSDEHGHDPVMMAGALLQLPQQRRPSGVVVPGLLDGMANVDRLAAKWLDFHRSGRLRLGARPNG
jgi:hypothetical protein